MLLKRVRFFKTSFHQNEPFVLFVGTSPLSSDYSRSGVPRVSHAYWRYCAKLSQGAIHCVSWSLWFIGHHFLSCKQFVRHLEGFSSIHVCASPKTVSFVSVNPRDDWTRHLQCAEVLSGKRGKHRVYYLQSACLGEKQIRWYPSLNFSKSVVGTNQALAWWSP